MALKRGGAPVGNQNRKKLKTPELRQAAYQAYCNHLAAGKSSRSFVFQAPGINITGKSIENMLRGDGALVEFPPIHKEIAEAKGFAVWEQIVEDSAIGKNPKVNTASLQMLMRNKFGWDLRRDKVDEIIDTSKLDALANLFSSIPSNYPTSTDRTPATPALYKTPEQPMTPDAAKAPEIQNAQVILTRNTQRTNFP